MPTVGMAYIRVTHIFPEPVLQISPRMRVDTAITEPNNRSCNCKQERPPIGLSQSSYLACCPWIELYISVQLRSCDVEGSRAGVLSI